MPLLTYAAASIFSALGTAATVSRCPEDDICYQVGVPEVSASSGSGNLYFQMRAPTSYSWVALGTGSQMSGSNIFLMYADGAGNVTVSARKGIGHTEPEHQTDTELELLAGSGIIDDGETMLANVRCANCESWDGGSMELTSTGAPFITAWKEGSAINSKSLAADIGYHDAHSEFTFDLTKATIADDANPFVEASSGGSGEGSTSPSNGNSGSGSDDDDDDDGSSTITLPAWIREIPTLESAHGIIMSIVMVVLYPLGSLLMPLFGSWVLHAVWQIGSFLVMWAGFAIGVILAQRTGYVSCNPSTIVASPRIYSSPRFLASLPHPIIPLVPSYALHPKLTVTSRTSLRTILFSVRLSSRSLVSSQLEVTSTTFIILSTRSEALSPTDTSGTAEFSLSWASSMVGWASNSQVADRLSSLHTLSLRPFSSQPTRAVLSGVKSRGRADAGLVTGSEKIVHR